MEYMDKNKEPRFIDGMNDPISQCKVKGCKYRDDLMEWACGGQFGEMGDPLISRCGEYAIQTSQNAKEVCSKFMIQGCGWCDDFGCCDNTNPDKD
jgi:hypothetical protein